MISFEEFMAKDKGSKKPLAEKGDSFKEEVNSIVNESIEEAEKKEVIEYVQEKIVNEPEETIVQTNHNINEQSQPEIVEEVGYKIFRDKAENFVCDMEISGVSQSKSKARIIIESKYLTYMFEGTIDPQGKCKIPLSKMDFLEENDKGIIRLEVIADDTVFTPWEDNYLAVTSKKVAVKTMVQENQSSKVGVRVSNIR